MELETRKNQQPEQNNVYKKHRIDSISGQIPDEIDIIDISKLNLSDDENWLFKSSNRSDTDLQKWLYNNDSFEDVIPANEPNFKEYTKNIDTRTFTRPKKRFTRPSIEKFNEELYANEMNDSGIQLNGCLQAEKPLHFDLAQPLSNSYYFDNILANAPMADSFQNMSPPSLVNSMCSSTFANLMENSFIKNDPVLREIRDADYTGLVLQQESEPLFQSITESCNSLNSDVMMENLKKIPFHDNSLDSTIILNTTFAKNDSSSGETITLDHDDDIIEDNRKLNGTYQNVNNGTFQRRKTNNRISNNSDTDLNVTMTIESKRKIEDKPLETTKRLLDRRPSPSMDLNRLSYQADKNSDRLNQTYTNENTKRNSIESSDSTENLDYMSLSSESSKISSNDGINAIGDVQERKQVMSTPKTIPSGRILWQGNDLSPISGRNSDPELSSSEKANPKSVIIANSIKKQKSTSNITSRMAPPRSFGTLTRTSMTKGSQPNLRTYGLPKTSNLNSMGHTLKGSYTSLKPMNPNLPVAPPPLDTTVTLPKATAQVAPLPREMKNDNAQFAKPQPMKSGLPRPMTGIPRPVSRIPGPRNIRPVSKSAGQPGRQSNRY